MDIGSWLRRLGLERYEPAFQENEIDETVLPSLTVEDLKELGVSALGHRRKLLDAIATLRLASKATRQAAGYAATTPTPLPAAVGERRHVTVMFCDLVDSTGIASKLDPEEWRDIVGAYLNAATAVVTEMGGHVAKKLGDGLMALFGYPVAQENDAERAARGALLIQEALTDLNRKNAAAGKHALAARIAIETGPVVVDTTGEIFGDVPNVAARAQALAEPGTIVVTARVQRQIAGLFVVKERGSHDLKGMPEAVTLFRLVRASGGGRRSGQRHLTPLVGRDEELAMLMRRWERARQGDGQLVLIVGEPGLGKSRLIEEFHGRLRDTPHTWVEWNCSQLLQNTPLHPIAELGRYRFGGAEIPADRRLEELESSLVQVKLAPAENVPLLAPLLDIPMPRERKPSLPPEELRRRQLAALTNWVLAGARSQPVVLAIEDVHWADPTTIDVLRSIAERGAPAPLFVLITARPEFRPPWRMRSHHGAISLAPLDPNQVRDMVAELSSRHVLPKEMIQGVTERTGGVPLFVEEVTRLLLEVGTQGGIHTIPPTLQQSLMARLDRLGAAREVAQIGAVIGREFSYPLLRSVAGMEEAALQIELERLAEADILLVRGLPPNSDYRFKHSLIQDTAYENLLKSRRQVLHHRVAEVLHDNFGVTAAVEPELLAHHLTEAGLSEEAIQWWAKAAERSLERSALAEAIEQFTRALAQIETLPPTPTLRREEIKLRVALITPLIHVKGHAAPETKAAVERSRRLIEQAEMLGEPPEDPLLLFSVLYGFWVANEVAFNGDVCLDLAARFLGLAEKQTDSVPLMIGHRLMGSSLLFAGGIAESRGHFDQAIALYNSREHRQLAARFGHDVRVIILCYRALTLWLLGYPSAALADADQALKDAREIGQAASLMSALCFTSLTYLFSGRYAIADAQLNEVVALAEQKGSSIWKAFGMMTQGYILARTGRVSSDAVHSITAGIFAWRSIGSTVFTPLYLSGLAKSYAEMDNFDEASRRIGEAISAIDATKEKWWEAEVYRVLGEIASTSTDALDVAEAEARFEQALAVARKQKAKSLELRAAISMAQLWRKQGKRDEARNLLTSVYDWFTEGFDTLDLMEAKALLDEPDAC